MSVCDTGDVRQLRRTGAARCETGTGSDAPGEEAGPEGDR